MTRPKLGLLGICVMALGLIFSASATQAETGAKWLFAEKGAGSGLVAFLEANGSAEIETTNVLHTKISGINVLGECPIIHVTYTLTGGKVTHILATYLKCVIKLNGAPASECEPIAEGIKGAIKLKPSHGLIVLHELSGGIKDDIVSILPDSGETFATIEMGALCPIGTKVPIIGKATVKDCQNLALTHLVKHLVELGPLTELFTISKTAEHIATVLGSSWTFLTGTHEGLKFSADPA